MTAGAARGGPPLGGEAAEALRELLGERFATSPSVLGLHSRDESRFAPREPDAVAFAQTVEEVSAILRTCSGHGVPVIPWGAGSSLEGHVLPVHGGVALDLTGMDRVLEVNAEDLDCRVQAGVHRLALEQRLGRDGLFFAVDPGADATLGGMAATAASGTRTTRYGTMRENVLGLRAVLADGTVIDTGSRARKSSAGYDLTRLLLGSEGTLAVICELTLRIHGIPEEIAAARCVFEGLEGAVATVTEAVQLGIPMARCELLDPAAIRAVNAHDGLSEPEAYTLFLEFHGGPASVAEQVESVREIAAAHGGGDFGWTKTTDERNALWRARHNAYFAVTATRPGTRAQTTDVCVPVSRLAESITASAADAAELPFPAAMVGHVADGNYHWICPVDTDSEAEQAALATFVERMVTRAQQAGGTCTGEHGVGLGKRDALLAQAGPDAVATMRALKQALDPRGILNPGKVLPDA
jgi:D-lactate dehydrogenase (cytochrome)